MLRTGDILVHSASGTHVVVRAAAADTHGQAVVLELVLEPNGYRPRLHRHPRQRQRFEVLAGSAGVQVGRRRAVVGSGARIELPPRVPHRVWNAGDEPLLLVAEVTPALRFESLVAALCAVEPPGRLRRAAIAAAHRDVVRPVLPELRLSRASRPRA